MPHHSRGYSFCLILCRGDFSQRGYNLSMTEHLLPSQNQLGEGPLWDHRQQTLYWVDIARSMVLSYHPASGERSIFVFNEKMTALGLRARGGFVAAVRNGFAFWNGDSVELDSAAPVEDEPPDNRFNDGAVDPGGRFWAGTMFAGPVLQPVSPGSLYRLDAALSVKCMQGGLTISNGIGWSPDNRTMYLTDTLRRLIYSYEFDLSSGEIANRRIFTTVPEEAGVPDGLTVDSEGCLWSACWGGWRLRRYDPQGSLEREVRLPVECPTSCTFGGESLNVLYITSAWIDLYPAQRKQQPWAGDVFCLEPGVKGLPANLFAG